MPYDAFISYCSEDKKIAAAASIRDGLLSKSIPGWSQ
jgi:hypothetical protein